MIKGILGNDLIQHFQVFELTESAGYKVLRLTDGFVPIGPIPKVKCTFKNKEKLSADAKRKSKTSKCVSSSVPTCNKFKPLTDFCSKPSTAHPPTNCKQCNTKSEKVGFKQSKSKPNKAKCAKSKGKINKNKRHKKLIAAVLSAPISCRGPCNRQ